MKNITALIILAICPAMFAANASPEQNYKQAEKLQKSEAPAHTLQIAGIWYPDSLPLCLIFLFPIYGSLRKQPPACQRIAQYIWES